MGAKTQLRVLLLALTVACALASKKKKPMDPMKNPRVAMPGVIELNPDNFDKVVNGSIAALVQFYSPKCIYCEKMVPEYRKLGEAVMLDPELSARFVIGKINAVKFENYSKTRHEVEVYPVVKYFPRGKLATHATGRIYNGGRKAHYFLTFLQKRLLDERGSARVKALDKIAARFGNATEKADQERILGRLEAAVEKLPRGDPRTAGELYLTVARKAIEKGQPWFEKERARLERMIGTGSLTVTKVADLAKQSSVMGAFLNETARVSPAYEDDDDDEEDYDEEEDEEEEYDEDAAEDEEDDEYVDPDDLELEEQLAAKKAAKAAAGEKGGGKGGGKGKGHDEL